MLSAGLLLLWVKAVGVAAELLAGVGLWLYLGFVKLPFSLALWRAVTDSRSYFAFALVLLLAVLFGPLRRFPGVPRGRWGGPARWLPAATAVGLLLFVLDALPERRSMSRFGFYPAFMPGQTYVIPGSAGLRLPDYEVRINPFGFRGRTWSLEAGRDVRRALVVGDSFVWGAHIRDEDGMLDRAIERELIRRSGQRWEVINIAATPAALWYYVHALIAVGREVKPALFIMSFLGTYDLEPWEVQRVKTGLPPAAVSFMDRFGISRNLHHAGARLGQRFARRGGADRQTLADLRSEFRKLVDFLEAEGGRLVIWEPMDPDPFFADYRHHPQIVFASWQDVPGLPERLRSGPRGEVPWQKDEDLSFRGDGHPTAKGNALFAKAIALKALGR
jgi:hypothetical protein